MLGGVGGGVFGNAAQLRAAATERGLHTAGRRADELGDLLERVVEDVLEQDTGPFLRRQRRHQLLDRAPEIRAGGLDRLDEVGREHRRLRFNLDAAAAEKIDAAVVRDPEQPGRSGRVSSQDSILR